MKKNGSKSRAATWTRSPSKNGCANMPLNLTTHFNIGFARPGAGDSSGGWALHSDGCGLDDTGEEVIERRFNGISEPLLREMIQFYDTALKGWKWEEGDVGWKAGKIVLVAKISEYQVVLASDHSIAHRDLPIGTFPLSELERIIPIPTPMRLIEYMGGGELDHGKFGSRVDPITPDILAWQTNVKGEDGQFMSWGVNPYFAIYKSMKNTKGVQP